MSEECKSISCSSIQVKHQQKTLSNKEKLDVISQLDRGGQTVDICSNVSSIHTIHDNGGRIKESAKAGTEVFV